ncbi:MAG: PEP-CTERM sorting domain-containing protein [Verrucomicrobiia bacterium]
MRNPTRRILRIFGVTILLGVATGSPSFANSVYWNDLGQTNSANTQTYSWNANNVSITGSPGWNGTNSGNPPYGGMPGYITNNLSATTSMVITDNSSWGAGGIVLSNSTGGSIQLIDNNGSFGFGTVVVGSNATYTIGSGGSLNSVTSFSLNSGGTMVLSNGTFSVTSGGLNVTVNGTVQNGAGASNTGTFGNGSGSMGVTLAAGGMMITNSGTLNVDSANAFTAGGLVISSGATVQVNSNATFTLDRYVNTAWTSGPAPTNSGVIYLNGGTFTFNDDGGGQNASRKMINNGQIIGNGTLAASIGQNGSGYVIASNGVLNILGSYAYGGTGTAVQAQIFDNGGAYGTYEAVSNGTLKVLNTPSEKSQASWNISGGGTLEIAANVALDLGYAYMPPLALSGVARVDSGANLTLSSAANGAAYSNSTGSSFIFQGGQINTGYASNNPAQFGNYGTLLAVTGNSTFETGGSTAGATSSGLLNLGTILATNNGSTFYIEPGNQYYNAFSNAVGSSVVVSNGATVAIARTAAAWTLNGTQNTPSDTNVVNAGNIVLNNGTFAMQIIGSAVGVGATNQFRNLGAISGQGLVLGTVNNLGSIMASGGGSLLVAGGDSSMGFNQAGTLQANASSTLIMSNASTVSMLSFTNGGTVVMNGGSLTARTIANSGTILTIGSGTISATISNLSGGFLSPGAGFGILNVGGNVDLGSNSAFSVELGLLPGQNDLLNVSSNLTLNAYSVLDLSGGAIGNVYTVATANAVSGTFGSVTPDYTVTYGSTDVIVGLVPEPSTMLLVIAGLGGVIALHRRRRR